MTSWGRARGLAREVVAIARVRARQVARLARWSFRGVRARVLLPWYRRTGRPVPDVTAFQRRLPVWAHRRNSQNGEDGILAAIFAVAGTTNRFLVEFGVEDGRECNSRYLLDRRGWTGLLMDGREPRPGSDVRRAFVTAENVESLFAEAGVPERFDLLSIDIDGNDYWVWKAIVQYRPRVVAIEYNASLPPRPPVTVPYDPAFAWDRSQYGGASLGALERLGREKGYRLIATDERGVNAFFVDEPLAPHFAERSLDDVYHPPAYHGIRGRAHPPDALARPWIEV